MKSRRNQVPYNPNEIESLKGIALPAKIKCGRCQKNLPQAKFSSKQLTDARRQIKASSQINKSINCQNCTGRQVVEVECTMCGKTKGLEDFAKSQRRNPDTAKCFACVEGQLANEAFNEDKYEDPDKAFVPPDHSNGQYPEYFAAATSDTSSSYDDDDWKTVNENHSSNRSTAKDGGIKLSADFQRAMSLKGSADENLIDYEYAFPVGRERTGNDGLSEVRTKSWHTQSSKAPTISSTSTINANSRSYVSAASSSHSVTSSVAERSSTSGLYPKDEDMTTTAPRGPLVRPMGDAARETGPLVDAWGDSDDSDEDDGDDDDYDDDDDDTII